MLLFSLAALLCCVVELDYVEESRQAQGGEGKRRDYAAKTNYRLCCSICIHGMDTGGYAISPSMFFA